MNYLPAQPLLAKGGSNCTSLLEFRGLRSSQHSNLFNSRSRKLVGTLLQSSTNAGRDRIQNNRIAKLLPFSASQMKILRTPSGKLRNISTTADCRYSSPLLLDSTPA